MLPLNPAIMLRSIDTNGLMDNTIVTEKLLTR